LAQSHYVGVEVGKRQAYSTVKSINEHITVCIKDMHTLQLKV